MFRVELEKCVTQFNIMKFAVLHANIEGTNSYTANAVYHMLSQKLYFLHFFRHPAQPQISLISLYFITLFYLVRPVLKFSIKVTLTFNVQIGRRKVTRAENIFFN